MKDRTGVPKYVTKRRDKWIYKRIHRGEAICSAGYDTCDDAKTKGFEDWKRRVKMVHFEEPKVTND